MVQALKLETTTARICVFEAGKREPNLLIVLAYGRAARINLEYLLDDDLDLDDAYD